LAYRLIIGILLLALIAGTIAIGTRSEAPDERDADAPAYDPGYVARDAEVVETGDDGHELYRLKADLIRQRPDAGVVELGRVHMNYFPAKDTRWNVTALRGEVQQTGERIRLAGDVNVTGPMPTAAQTIQLDTDTLDIQTREQVITTDAPVTLTWSGQRLSAIGLRANLKEEKVELQSKVNGRFVP